MSVSSVSLNSDANVRYQRLASEYGKLRTQAKVLREGVLSEREKSEKLTEELKLKEAIIRKLMTENESLQFRNDQLVKRVENLQNEVDALAKPNFDNEKPTKKNASTKKAANTIEVLTTKVEVLEGELRLKLMQNEKLVSQINENDQLHEKEMVQLSEKFAKEYRALELKLEQLKSSSNVVIPDKKIVKSEKDSKPMEAVKPFEKSVSEQMEMEIASPVPPQSAQEATLMVAETAKTVLYSLHTFFNLMQQRSEMYPYDVTLEVLPKHVEKISSEYAQCARLFLESSEVVDEFLQNSIIEIDNDLPKLMSKIDLISKHCKRLLLDLVKLMNIEENKVNWCTKPLTELNDEWFKLMDRLFASFENVHSAMSMSTSSLIVEELGNFSELCAEMSSTFSRRWLLESRLPTTTKRLRCIGSALENSIRHLSSEVTKLHARACTLQKITKPAVAENDEPNDSNPFNDDIENGVDEKTITDGVERIDNENALSNDEKPREEAEMLREKVKELQVERDKHIVDFSLLKRKIELANGNKTYRIDLSEIDKFREIGRERTTELMQLALKADHAARYYKQECEMLITIHLSIEKDQEKILNEMETMRQQKRVLEEEIESIRRSYENQIRELSDHIANMAKVAENENVDNQQERSTKGRSTLKSFFKS
ncbi:unnamed protein product [Caenorhabditis bovis]|uniref:Protein phosphatase 1 regulatory subunit 21 N-terminal domain-containing protein n=1 Tax=Caenorhabditis bovis TaxID=2654633 RepID=A0A8S1EK17_9PELO|nr:unnamed protein product [Caenorhabditis bovis]